MSAIEVIEQIRALPEEERAKVVRFVIEHEESWIPTEFIEGDLRILFYIESDIVMTLVVGTHDMYR